MRRFREPLFHCSLPSEEKLFHKYGYDVTGIFMGSSQLINTAILSGELMLGYAGGGGVISSRLAGSDLIAIASPLPVLTIDGWAKTGDRIHRTGPRKAHRDHALQRIDTFCRAFDA